MSLEGGKGGRGGEGRGEEGRGTRTAILKFTRAVRYHVVPISYESILSQSVCVQLFVYML